MYSSLENTSHFLHAVHTRSCISGTCLGRLPGTSVEALMSTKSWSCYVISYSGVKLDLGLRYAETRHNCLLNNLLNPKEVKNGKRSPKRGHAICIDLETRLISHASCLMSHETNWVTDLSSQSSSHEIYAASQGDSVDGQKNDRTNHPWGQFRTVVKRRCGLLGDPCTLLTSATSSARPFDVHVDHTPLQIE